MPTEPAQLALAAFETCLLLGGLVLLLWLVANPAARARWFGTQALPAHRMAPADFVLAAVLIMITGLAFQSAAQLTLAGFIAGQPDQPGLALSVYSMANYLGAFVGWKFFFPSLRRSWVVEPEPAAPPRPAPLPWSTALRLGAATLAVALPVLSVISLLWTFVLEQLNLPHAPQDVVAIFANTRSPLIIGAMLLVACVLAPVYEELLFRAGLYRFCRQRLGRGAALVISGAAFGALHGYWLSFLPLAALGIVLAMVYEATGSIRVPIIAHSLFNLNTVLMLLSGLQDLGK